VKIAFAFVAATVGVALFRWLELPLPWLLGPIFACLVAALAGVPLAGYKPLNDSMRTILGVAVGATVTPAVIASVPGMWPTLLLVPVMILAIGMTGVPYFQRIWGYNFATAYYATMPGGLQDMLIFGEEAGGNVRTLSLVHATRVMVIVVALPFILKFVWEADLSNSPGAPIASVPLDDLLIMVFCAGFGWWAARRVGMFGASILGPMIATAAAALSGLIETGPPAEAIWAAQFFIGMIIGSKYSGITMTEVRRDLTAGLGFCAILIVLTLIFVEFIFRLNLAPEQEALLAFAPGGQTELTLLALIVGADAAFVVTHHILRTFLVILGAPLAAKVYDRRRTED
jgi:hypothetical protein